MPSRAGELLTILVPTCNRYPFLLRLLRYYRACGTPFPMHILDSSEVAQADAELKALASSLPITYRRHDPHILPIPKLSEGFREVTSPYVVFWADDDLMVPRSLGLAAEFLEEHGDFSVAHGRSGIFLVDADRDGRITTEVGPSFRRSYTEDTAAARLRSYVTSGGSLFYSVHRTEWLRQNIERCTRLGFGYYWAELTLAWLTMIQGKSKVIDCLYMLRQVHGGQAAGWHQTGTFDNFDWVTRPGFPEQYTAFRDCLAEELARQDGMPLSQAQEVVKEAMWFYLARSLTRKWNGLYRSSNGGWRRRLRERARRVPGLRATWHTLQAFLPGESHALSLAALRRPFSRFHRDFMPMCRAIMEQDDWQRRIPG